MPIQTKVIPLEDRVMIAPVKESEKKYGSLIIPDISKERPTVGIIQAVGEGKYLDSGKLLKLNLKVGDKVMYAKYAGTPFNVDDTEVIIIRAVDVLAVLEETEDASTES